MCWPPEPSGRRPARVPLPGGCRSRSTKSTRRMPAPIPEQNLLHELSSVPPLESIWMGRRRCRRGATSCLPDRPLRDCSEYKMQAFGHSCNYLLFTPQALYAGAPSQRTADVASAANEVLRERQSMPAGRSGRAFLPGKRVASLKIALFQGAGGVNAIFTKPVNRSRAPALIAHRLPKSRFQSLSLSTH